MFFRRQRQQTPTIPLEGALGPNGRLDDAEAFPIAAPEAICVQRDGPLLVSSGSEVLRIGQWGGTPEPWGNFDARVTALAVSDAGLVAVGLSGGRVSVRSASGEPQSGWTPSSGPRAIADCLFLSEDELAVVDHGYGPEEPILSLAPWDTVARGQVLGIAQSGATRVIAAQLHCPMGIALGLTARWW